jgi:23S rRNA pseudouridine2605 synthase
MMRLNQYLAACGLGSRRACEALVAAGRVRVNGETAHFGMRVGPGDRVLVDETEVVAQPAGEIWLLHKPAGTVSTARDERGRPTVFDLARRHGIRARLFSVGRLDLETTGLLLLTNDGDLAFRLTHPSHGVEKEYEARIERPLDDSALDKLRTGLDLEDGRTAPCDASQEVRRGETTVRLVLHEGRKRQVRRMLFALGAPVISLHRVRVGPVRLGDLRPGELRPATEAERAALRAAAGEPATT